MAQRGREIDNVRQALDWAFGDGGDAAIGVALTALCAPVWLYLSLLVECRDQAQRALAHPAHVETLSRELQIQLYTTLGVALVYTGGSVQRTAAILTTAEKVSRELDDRLPRLQVLWATWILRFLNGELVTARQVVEQFSQLAQRPQDIVQSGRMMGSTMLDDGRLAQARQHFERLLGVEAAPASQRQLQWYHYDGTVLAQSRLARVLWLQGFIDQAVRLAADGLARAQALDHKLSICFALSEAVCPIALMSGDLQCADWSVDMLSEIATRHSFHSQMVLGRKFDAQLRVKRGEPATGVGILRTASRTLAGAGLTLHYAGLIGDYAEVLAANGELSAGQAAIDAGLALAERDGVRWHLAELHRLKGELALRRCEPSSEPVAEACFEEAITVAEFRALSSGSCGPRPAWRDCEFPRGVRGTPIAFSDRSTIALPKGSCRRIYAQLNPYSALCRSRHEAGLRMSDGAPAMCLASGSQLAEALATVDGAPERSGRGGECWNDTNPAARQGRTVATHGGRSISKINDCLRPLLLLPVSEAPCSSSCGPPGVWPNGGSAETDRIQHAPG